MHYTGKAKLSLNTIFTKCSLQQAFRKSGFPAALHFRLKRNSVFSTYIKNSAPGQDMQNPVKLAAVLYFSITQPYRAL